MSERQYLVAGFAVPDELETFHQLLARVGEEHPDLDATALMAFETAVIEIATNVVEHAEGATWSFTLVVTTTRLQGTLTDDGPAFDGDLDAALPDDLLAESGRGLPMARALLDELTYQRTEQTNRWLMVRRREGAEQRTDR